MFEMREVSGPLEQPCDIHDEVGDWLMTAANEGRKPLGRGVTGTRKKKNQKAETPTVRRLIYPVLKKTQGQQNKTNQQRGLYKKNQGLIGTGVEWRDRNGRSTGRRRKRCQDHSPTYLEKPSSLLSGILDVPKDSVFCDSSFVFFTQLQELKEI